MNITKTALFFSMAIIRIAASAATRTFYLDPGKGTAEGSGTESEPFWTFESAIDAANKATETNIVVYVDNSQDHHQFLLTNSISIHVNAKSLLFQPWTTASSGDFNVILDGQGKCSCVGTPDYVTNNATFRNFTLRNGNDANYGGGAYTVTLINSLVTNCTAGIAGGGVCASKLRNCVIADCRSGGNGGGATESTLFNCLVLNNRAPNGCGGGAYHSSLFNCTFDGNTALQGGGYISSTNEEDEVVQVINSIILDNGTNLWTELERSDDLYRCVFTDGDPKFVDAAHGDYRLRADSPCLDYGYLYPEDLPETDLDGNPRLRGAELDLGCYEFQRHAAFQPGTLDVSSNTQVIGTVMYAQGPWSIAVNDEARGWLSADVTSGSVSNTLRFTFAENTTGADRSATVSVRTNGADTAVQQITVRQVAGASGCKGTRRGVFIGCAYYGPNEKGKPWQRPTDGADRDAEFYREMWCEDDDFDNTKICKLLLNEDATSKNVFTAVDTVIAELQANDEFMLSVAGHGLTLVPTWEHALSCLYPNNESLHFDEISNILIRAAAKCSKVICCIDTCNAAGAYKFADQLSCDGEIVDRRDMPRLALSASPSLAEPYRSQPKIAFIVASNYDQLAQGNKTNGEFTGAIKNGYTTGNADADGDGHLNLHELYRYAYHTASQFNQTLSPGTLVQGRCYNKPLLLKTIVGPTFETGKPDLLNPYYVDFVNWVQRGTLASIPNPASTTNVTDVVTDEDASVPLKGGGQLTLADAFIAGYDPVQAGVTNEPFRVSIAVTNGIPHLSWSPDRSKDAAPLRTYAIRANTSLTNLTNWATLPANATPEQLQSYKFFRVDVKLRQ